MARKRFNAGEKALIAGGKGQPIEWQNVTQWHAGTILDPEIRTDYGWQYVVITNHSNTRTLRAGEQIHLTPGHIRAEQ